MTTDEQAEQAEQAEPARDILDELRDRTTGAVVVQRIGSGQVYWRVRRLSAPEAVEQAVALPMLMALAAPERPEEDPEIAAARAEAQDDGLGPDRRVSLIEWAARVARVAVTAISRDGEEWAPVHLVGEDEPQEDDAIRVSVLDPTTAYAVAIYASEGAMKPGKVSPFRPGSGPRSAD